MMDAAYDSDAFRSAIATKGAQAPIPNNPSRAKKYPLNKPLYAEHRLIECIFSKLKRFRGVSPRSEKTARNYFAVVAIASVSVHTA
jgi:transposase